MENKAGEGHTVARNALYLLSGKLISTVLGVSFVLYTAVQLGAADFGIYTLSNYYAGLFVILGDLGLSNYATREIARHKDQAQEIINRIFSLKFVLSLLAFTIGVNILLLVDYGLYIELLTFVVLFTQIFFRSYLSFLFHIFEGFERMEFITISEAFRRGIDLGVCITVLSLGYGLAELILGLVLSDLIILLFTWMLCKRMTKVRFRFVFDSRTWFDTLSTAIPFGLLLISLGLINSIDTTMLGRMRTVEEVGWYGSVIRITTVLTIIPMMAASAMFPATSRLFLTSIDKAREIFRNLARYMTLIGLPVAVGTTMLAPSLIVFLYDPSYAPAAQPLKIVIWSITLAFINLPIVMLLSSIEQQKQATVIIGAGAIVNFILNWFLIPPYGMMGAATTTVISQIIILVFGYIKLIKFFKHLKWTSFLFQAVTGCAGMGLVLWLLPPLHPAIMILTGMISYLAVLALIGAVSREDWQNMMIMVKPGG